jgi:heme A synthase
MKAARLLSSAALWGALLTAVILAMSVLLRLGTQLEAGEAVSTLPAAVEQWARLAHRVAAMAVGILAALALVAVVRDRPLARERIAAVACVVLLTLLLAVIGRYTPGYRLDLVTMLNVVGGTALAAAFWWLRAPREERGAEPVAFVALALLLVLAALGAAADAAAMRGQRILGPLHLWVAGIFVVLALVAAWRQRHRRALAAAVATLTVVQFVLGFALVAAPVARPIAPAWIHAMIALTLALLLVSLARAGPLGAPARDQPGLPSALGRQ